MQILVLGMHRAGTSTITRLINMMGAYFAPEGISVGFSKANPKGFWERKDVLAVNGALLKHFDCAWHRVDGWDDSKLDTIPGPILRGIRTLVLELDAHRPWVMKDPRLCLTLPCWLPFLEVPVAVVATRHPLATARSLELRNGLPIEYGLALWEYHAVHTIRHSCALPKAQVSYEAILSEPVKTVEKLHDALLAHGVQGLRMPREREILAFVEPKFQRARETDAADLMTQEQRTLVAMLRGEAMADPKIEVSAESARLMKRMGRSLTGAPVES